MKKTLNLILGFFCMFFSLHAQKNLYQNTALGNSAKVDLSDAIEEVEARTERTSLFRFSDGRIISKNSFSPIHYKDESGKWQPITKNYERYENELQFSEQKLPIVISDKGFIRLNAKGKESVAYRPYLFQHSFNLNNLVEKEGFFEYRIEGLVQKLDVRNNAVKSSLFISEVSILP